jgi:hypothetical protein
MNDHMVERHRGDGWRMDRTALDAQVVHVRDRA